ncbi:MAG TPA: DUF3078 domain-containing protein [Bacteroidales bacterium]|nr:DUF3078 domain-containing protein [Bacteroidales bacterium]HCI55074.1 hypothetical protein [Bacteroidales bacterium]HQG52335.1 DUF3078 domain-containing protein [Bacteroidales bacterium]HRC88482.1 DUF3078 domain-containing protein [Bacteroidales bacterium]
MMKKRPFFLFSTLCFLFSVTFLWGQELPLKELDSSLLKDSLSKMGFYVKPVQTKADIKFTTEEAIKYLQEKYNSGYWRNLSEPLRVAIGQLLFYATNKPFDSLKVFLEKYPYDSINIPPEKFYVFDTIRVKIPVVLPGSFTRVADSIFYIQKIDSLESDTARSKNILSPASVVILKDTCLLIVKDTLKEYKPPSELHPFKVYKSPFLGDSLLSAVKALTDYIEERDSTIIVFKGTSSNELPIWLNSKSKTMSRYWLRNEYDDSVTVWLGSIGRDTIGIYLEEGIMFRRLAKHTNISDAQLNIKEINSRQLQELNKIYVKPRYWKFRSEATFVLNQAMQSNWVKGGENSISTTMDITSFANYENKEMKLISNNFVRLKYGLIKPGDKPIRKNLDLLETNSKLNHKAFGKFDISATMLLKTQISKGYNYPNDSIPVSKFFNPAILTLGLGLDYKPNKTTSINIAPLSYKATFVPDTAGIDQTQYGVPKNRRSLHEPGASAQINSELRLLKNINMVNRIQLFTNYTHNPQNIDIDWEMILNVQLNWFTDLRLNTHLIFDDDTKTVVNDTDGQPKKTARIQFKELLGVSFVFRF